MNTCTAVFLLACISLCKSQDGPSIVNIYQGLPIQNISASLQSILDRLDSMQKIIETCACKSDKTEDVTPSEQEDFVQTACATDRPAVISPGVYALDGQIGSWPASGFCRVYVNEALDATKYNISADLYNAKSTGGVNYGHLGIFYNAVDINNFDFVYLRQHSAGSCYQTGQVVKGGLNRVGSESRSCPNGVPPGASWYNVKVAVNGNKADIYRDDVLLASISNYFGPRASGGVLVANGYGNLGHFRNVKIAKSE